MKETSGKRNAKVEAGNSEARGASISPAVSDERMDAAALAHLPEHLAAAVKKRWKCYRKELKGCKKKFSEKGVHQFRVETRRLLSLIELLAPFLLPDRVNKIRACLKRHLDIFDDLRDTHVQFLLTRKWCQRFPEASAFEGHLRKREKWVHRQTLKDIKKVKIKRLARLIGASRKDLKALIETTRTPALRDSRSAPQDHSIAPRGNALLAKGTPGTLLLREVDSAFQRTSELRARVDPAKTKTIHCTRVAFKRFRYMVETLAAFLKIVPPGKLASMHRYQTLMGEVQDLEVLIRAFEKFDRKKKLQEPTRSLSANGESGRPHRKSFRDELLRRRQRFIERYLTRADELDTFWPSFTQKRIRSDRKPVPADIESHR
jgi:CHAD domain-containing protein